jgi:preprotein translocase subunit SecE
VALKIYKASQGRYVRVSTAVAAALVDLVICYYIGTLLLQYVPDFGAKAYLVYGAPAVVFAVLAVVAAYYLNKPNVVDFLVATESEMRKVSWSSRAELIGSTTVVIMTVFALAIFIFVADYVFTNGLGDGIPVPFTGLKIPGLGLW